MQIEKKEIDNIKEDLKGRGRCTKLFCNLPLEMFLPETKVNLWGAGSLASVSDIPRCD